MTRRRHARSSPSRQRGVALIMAVLIVALATILAVNVTFRGMVDQRRAANLFALDQGFEVALGAEAWAADILRKDAQDSQTDHFGEIWAKSMAALPIDEGVGTVEGRIEDMQGRFNLNNLVFSDGTTNETAVKQLERMLSDARDRADVGHCHGRLDRLGRPARLSRWRRGLGLHGARPAAPRGQHADHPHQRAHGAARVRCRSLSTPAAVHHGTAGRNQAAMSAPRPASCSTRCRQRSGSSA